MTKETLIEEEPPVAVTVANETGRAIQLWMEPGCQTAAISQGQKLSFRGRLIGDTQAAPSNLGAVIERLSDKVNGGTIGPSLDIILDENEDGSLILTLWLDQADSVGY